MNTVIIMSCLKLSDAFKGPRLLLTQHAIMNNVIARFRDELAQQQFDTIASTEWNSLSQVHNNYRILESHVAFFLALVILYNYSNPLEKSYKKLYVNISDYRDISKMIKYMTIIFVMIFLRDVQNAI